jgi:hypothetical protein
VDDTVTSLFDVGLEAILDSSVDSTLTYDFQTVVVHNVLAACVLDVVDDSGWGLNTQCSQH